MSKLATTSFIWPKNIWENCKKLQNIVDEVAILFFETDSSLKYTQKDLPLELKNLELSYHVHLPLDLPWEEGYKTVFDLICKLIEKVSFLDPKGFVFHPPSSREDLIRFLDLWEKNISYPIFLENTKECDLISVWDIIENSFAKVCVDVGHIIEFKQYELLKSPNLWEKTKMLHIYAPTSNGHGSLKLLKKEEEKLVREILYKALDSDPSITVVLEVFSFSDLKESLDIFHRWIRNKL